MRTPHQRGFSLLELLVVLFVIVIVASLVNLSVSSGGEDMAFETEVRNIADVSRYALDEAEFAGEDFGLLLLRRFVDGETIYVYSWRQRQTDGWREPELARDVFVERAFPASIDMELELVGLPVPDFADADDTDLEPQIVFYASGETIPGALQWRARDSGDLLWRLEWDLLGRFTAMRRGQPVEENDDAEL